MKLSITLRKSSIALAALGLLCLSAASHAATRNVPFQYPNIQAAVNAAVAGDTVLVGTGIYSGTGNVNIDTLGKAVTIKSLAGAGSCILDGGASNHFFNIHSGETVHTIINGFTLQNGYDYYGGAFYIYNSSPTITGCVVKNCAGYYGGAAYISEANATYSPTFTNNTFYMNSGYYFGGAMYIVQGATKITNCTFQSNNAYHSGGAILFVSNDKSKIPPCRRSQS